MFETTEGFFLTYNQTNLTHLKRDERAIHDLLLSESDGIELRTFNTLHKLREELCNVEEATIRAFRQHKDKFNLLYAGNKSIVVFSKDGIIFTPNCSRIDYIILDSYDDCSHDPLINFDFKTEKLKGYLTTNNIIRKDNKFDCKLNRIRIRKVGMQKAIINSKEVTLINPKYAFEIGSLDSEVDKLSFSHDETIKAIELLNSNNGYFETKTNFTQMYQDSYDSFIDSKIITRENKKMRNFAYCIILLVGLINCDDNEVLENLCDSSCIHYDTCSRNGTINLCDCPLNATYLMTVCEKSKLFCDSHSKCKNCKEKFSGEHGFGYECECDDEKEDFYCKGQEKVIEAIEMVSDMLGKVLGGIAGGVVVGFLIVILVCCGVICCACFCCIKFCQSVSNCFKSDNRSNSYVMTPTVVTQNPPIYTRNDYQNNQSDEKQKFIPTSYPIYCYEFDTLKNLTGYCVGSSRPCSYYDTARLCECEKKEAYKIKNNEDLNIFCEPSLCKNCKHYKSSEFGFGYECFCFNRIFQFFCKNTQTESSDNIKVKTIAPSNRYVLANEN
ncbi:unnamed protein product, partial [Brachionus calyciflorus]